MLSVCNSEAGSRCDVAFDRRRRLTPCVECLVADSNADCRVANCDNQASTAKKSVRKFVSLCHVLPILHEFAIWLHFHVRQILLSHTGVRRGSLAVCVL